MRFLAGSTLDHSARAKLDLFPRRSRATSQFSARHVFFARNGGVNAQSFDPGLLQLSGEPIPVAPREMDIRDAAFYHSAFSVSETGTLIFQSRTDFAGN